HEARAFRQRLVRRYVRDRLAPGGGIHHRAPRPETVRRLHGRHGRAAAQGGKLARLLLPGSRGQGGELIACPSNRRTAAAAPPATRGPCKASACWSWARWFPAHSAEGSSRTSAPR